MSDAEQADGNDTYDTLYEEECQGLDGPRRYLQDGPRAVTWHVAELKETAQVAPPTNNIFKSIL